jgi:Cu/Zn superoxide dismutase
MQKRIMMPLAVVIAMLMMTMSFVPVAAIHEDEGETHEFADDDFEATWNRTDLPVETGEANDRTWIWGNIYTDGMMEDYAESPEGQRLVQYFDKSRMEINDPDAFNDGLWYVTNGLLVVEMVEGWYQIGDDEFDQSPDPAEVNIVGDPAGEEGLGPTYADINAFGLMDLPATEVGTTIAATIDGEGNITDDQEFAGYAVTAAQQVTVPGIDHTVASVFWEFMNSEGVVWEDGQLVTERVFENEFYGTGYPVTEAYWTTAMVAGSERDVLWQCFERRCLTYTPGNPEAFLVEAGNVGQHYYRWRHGEEPTPTTEEYEVQFGQLNGSGVSGTATIALTGNELVIDLQASGLEEGTHMWHIHGKGDGSDASCPTMDLDTNDNGYIELEEGLPAYGGVIRGLPDLVVDATGTVDTTVTVTLTDEELTAIGDFLNNVLVIHGMTVDLDGDGEGEAAYVGSLPVACGDVNEPGFFEEAEPFDVAITSLNESGVDGTAHLELLGDLLMVELNLTGLEPGVHPMHIHGLESGDASCPTMDLDTNGNGYIELEEGLPAYGPVLVPLGMPTVGEDGTLTFSGSYIVDAAALGDLLTRVIVIHGMTADLDGEGEGEAEYVASLPVACGDLHTPEEPEPPADVYTTTIDAQNESGVTGNVLFTLDGDQLTVVVQATGLTADEVHAISLRGLAEGAAACPTGEADTDEDGYVDLEEGALVFGDEVLALGAPTADAEGNLVFETTLTVDPETLPTLTDLAVVILGLSIDPDGEGEEPAVFDPLMPVGCGLVAAGGAQATADIMDSSGTTIGSAHLVETATGVLVHVEVTDGIAPGLHGTHIHETGTCTAPGFESAGAHFNPTGATHPNHAGDLGNLVVLEDMTGHLVVLNDAITLGEGDNSLFDADGSAIVIHAGEDDMMTDPGGNSGARVACGVITAVGDTP